MESIPRGEKIDKVKESDFIEFRSYKKLANGVVVAVMYNEWRDQEFPITKEKLERRLEIFSSKGEKPDVSEQVLQNWPNDLE